MSEQLFSVGDCVKSSDDEGTACHACGWDGGEVQIYRNYGRRVADPGELPDKMDMGDERIVALCSVCANTMIGSIAQYQSARCSPDAKLLQTIGYCTNLIISEIRKARAK